MSYSNLFGTLALSAAVVATSTGCGTVKTNGSSEVIPTDNKAYMLWRAEKFGSKAAMMMCAEDLEIKVKKLPSVTSDQAGKIIECMDLKAQQRFVGHMPKTEPRFQDEYYEVMRRHTEAQAKAKLPAGLEKSASLKPNFNADIAPYKSSVDAFNAPSGAVGSANSVASVGNNSFTSYNPQNMQDKAIYAALGAVGGSVLTLAGVALNRRRKEGVNNAPGAQIG